MEERHVYRTRVGTGRETRRKKRFVLKGVMQAPVTPLHDDFSVDYDGLAKMVDFHVRNGAPAIAWPHHKAESPNLTIEERKQGAEVLIKTVAKRVPVSIFAAALSEEDALDIARHAQRAGADMLLTISPYCRRPTQEEIFHSIVRIGTHTDLPVLTYNSPWRNGEGVEFTSDLVARLIERLPNYIGMKDAGFHSEKFLEISRVALNMRPGFFIIMGLEHLLASYPLGACGSFSSCGAIAPNLCNRLLRRARGQRLADRPHLPDQDHQALSPVQGPVSLVAQGRHDQHGTAGRTDPAAAADGDPGTSRVPVPSARGTRRDQHRASRLVEERNMPMKTFKPGLVHCPSPRSARTRASITTATPESSTFT